MTRLTGQEQCGRYGIPRLAETPDEEDSANARGSGGKTRERSHLGGDRIGSTRREVASERELHDSASHQVLTLRPALTQDVNDPFARRQPELASGGARSAITGCEDAALLSDPARPKLASVAGPCREAAQPPAGYPRAHQRPPKRPPGQMTHRGSRSRAQLHPSVEHMFALDSGADDSPQAPD